MPGRGTTDALFVVGRMQGKYKDKKKLYMCFVDIEKAFDSSKKGDESLSRGKNESSSGI